MTVGVLPVINEFVGDGATTKFFFLFAVQPSTYYLNNPGNTPNFAVTGSIVVSLGGLIQGTVSPNIGVIGTSIFTSQSFTPIGYQVFFNTPNQKLFAQASPNPAWYTVIGGYVLFSSPPGKDVVGKIQRWTQGQQPVTFPIESQTATLGVNNPNFPQQVENQLDSIVLQLQEANAQITGNITPVVSPTSFAPAFPNISAPLINVPGNTNFSGPPNLQVGPPRPQYYICRWKKQGQGVEFVSPAIACIETGVGGGSVNEFGTPHFPNIALFHDTTGQVVYDGVTDLSNPIIPYTSYAGVKTLFENGPGNPPSWQPTGASSAGFTSISSAIGPFLNSNSKFTTDLAGGSLSGTYWIYGDCNFNFAGTVNVAHNTRVYVNGNATFTFPCFLNVATHLGANYSSQLNLTSQIAPNGIGLGGGQSAFHANNGNAAGGGGFGGNGGVGGGATFNWNGGQAYPWRVQSCGSQGGIGGNWAAPGGFGGGSFYLEAAGTILFASNTNNVTFISANGANGVNGNLGSGFYAGGGGSGGLIVLRCYQMTTAGGFTGTWSTASQLLTVTGGNGGNDVGQVGGGGGGGCGVIDIGSITVPNSTLFGGNLFATGVGGTKGTSAAGGPTNGQSVNFTFNPIGNIDCVSEFP